MSSMTYAEAVDGALDRLQSTGFYLGDTFANHGPMAAEALARLGYCDAVDGWVDDNIGHRQYGPLHKPSQPIDAESRVDWQPAWEITSAAAIGSSCFVANWPRPHGEPCLKAGGPACFPAAPDR